MKSTQPTVECNKCSGTGQITIRPKMQECLEAITAYGEATAIQTYDYIFSRGKKRSVKRNAIGNRIVWLVNNGLATRVRKNGVWFYSVKEGK